MAANIDLFINGQDKTTPAFNSVKNGINGLSQQAGAISSKVSAAAVAVGTVIGNLATTAITKIGQMSASVVTAGVDFNNMKQQADIAFTTMLGSGEKAKGFLDQLQKFAAETPFEFPELLQASQRMIAMGIESDKVLPTLTAIGDAVAGLGGSSEMVNRVTTAIGQMQAKGKASAEEMMQLTEAGIPAWEMLASKIGVDIPTAMDMVSKGAVDSTTAIGALVDGMNDKFGGMMEKQSTTFGGLWSTIMDVYTQVSAKVIKPFFELMTKGFQSIVDWTNSPQFTAGVESLTRWVEIAANAAEAFFKDILAGVEPLDALSHALRILLPPAIFNTWEQFAGVLDSVFNIAKLLATGDFTGGIFGFTEDHPAILALFTIRGLITGIFEVMTGKISAMDFFKQHWENLWATVTATVEMAVDFLRANLPAWVSRLQEWGQAAWQWIVDTAIPMVAQKLGEWGDTLRGWVTDHLPRWVETLKTWGNAAWQWIVDALPVAMEKLGQWSKSLIEWMGGALPGFIATVLEWGTALYKWIGDVIPNAINAMADYVARLREKGEGETHQLATMAGGWASTLWRWIRDDLIPKVGPAFTDFIGAMLDYGKKLLAALGNLAKELGLLLWEWIVDITPTALKKISEWGSALWNWIKDNAPAWGDKLAKWGALAWEWIRDVAIPEASKKIKEWGEMLWNWVKDNGPTFGEKILEWAGMAWEWIRDVAIPKGREQLVAWGEMLIGWLQEKIPVWRDKLVEVGENIVTGLRAGIEEKWLDFKQWWNNWGPIVDLINLAKNILGVASPSRVFWGIGQDVMAGMQKGVHEGGVYVKQTLEDHSVVWENIATGRWIPFYSKVGQQMARSIGDGLKSETEYVAEQIKATLDRANSEMLAGVAYFTQQAEIKMAAAHYKIAHAAKDLTNLPAKLGIDPALLPKEFGGTGKVVGYGPNGELILEGITNLPSIPKPAETPVIQPPAVTLDSAVGGTKTTTGTGQSLMGGITLTTPDIKGAENSIKEAKDKVVEFIAGLGDFLKATVDNRAMSKVFQTLDKNLTGLTELRAADANIAKYMADLLGIERMYGTLSDNLGLVMEKITGGTDLNKIANLLQSAVDFRTLANHYSTADYADVLPTDQRLTGGNTTNTFYITLQGSNNASADVLSIVELLGSLQGAAIR